VHGRAIVIALPWFLTCGSDAVFAAPRGDGLPQPILRGHPAGPGEQWGTVAVLVGQGNEAWDCTGTLIGARLVLTAAPCVQDDQTGQLADHVEVIAGADDVNMAAAEQRYSCTHFAPHPQAFHNQTSDDPAGIGAEHDLALLYTDRPVMQMSVMGILPASRLDSELTAGTRLTIAGFGDNALSRSGASFSEGDMVQYVGELGFVRRGRYEFLAGGPDDSDTCQGDSGGPAYLKLDDTMWLVGTTARGRVDYRDVDCGMGGIYTLVPAYQAWIASTTQRLAEAQDSDPPAADAGMPDAELDMSDDDSPATPSDVGIGEVLQKQRAEGCTLAPFARRSTLLHALWMLPALLLRRRLRTARVRTVRTTR
jgi:V8-like Glu-specific endopeptidase